jgi:hypothetical protein
MKANILPLKPELLEATLGFKYRQRSSPTIHKMPRQSTATQTRLKTITECLTMTANTLEVLADDLKIPLLVTISNTTQSLLKCIQVNSSE